jgi:probable rRNA maturation factor
LVICSAVVNAEAQQQDKLESAHWAHMVIHGCLHLQGFDHQLDAQAEQMEALERQLLAELKFSDPY